MIMVDKKILREMSQDVLVIPFTEEMADKLDKFCRIHVKNIEQNKVEKLIMSFLTRKNDKELEMAFNKYATESEQTNNILPVAILPVLAEYIVLLVIDGCEETKRRALYTLMLKNALLIAVKGDGFVAHPKAVADIFGNYYDYLRDEKVFGKGEENNNVLAELLDADEESFTEKIGEVDSETIKAIVYDAVLYRYANFIKDIKIDTEHLVKGVFLLSKQLVYNTPWRYADTDVAHTIKKLLGERGEETIQLGMVKEELKEFMEGEEISYGLTSVLLRLINDDDAGIDLPNATEFKVNELTVYLFYEFLAEAMSSEIDDIAE